MSELGQSRPDRIAQDDARHEHQPANTRTQENVGRASRCERLARRHHQNTLEAGSRFGERRRIKGAVVDDRDQIPSRHPRDKTRCKAPASGLSLERCDDPGGETTPEKAIELRNGGGDEPLGGQSRKADAQAAFEELERFGSLRSIGIIELPPTPPWGIHAIEHMFDCQGALDSSGPSFLRGLRRGGGQICAVGRAREVHERTDRNDPGRIDIVVREVIVALDVVEVDRFGDAVDLIEIA